MARLAVFSSGSHALSLGRVIVERLVFSEDAQQRAQLHPPLRLSFRHAVPTANSSTVHVRVLEVSLLIRCELLLTSQANHSEPLT